jgi:PAS domain S-box-containing protein
MGNMEHRLFEELDRSDGCLESKELFRSLFEQAPVAIVISRNGRIAYNNPRFLELFGYQSNDEVRGHPITEEIAPGHREGVLELALRHERGQPTETEFEAVGLRKDGSEFPFHVTITRASLPDGPAILGFFTDITDRKKMEGELRQSHDLLNAVVENTSDAIFVKDRQGKYLLFNRGAAAMAGVNAEEAIGKDDDFVFSMEIAKIIKSDDQEVMARGVTIAFDTSAVIDGVPRTWSAKKTPLRDHSQKVIGIIGISRDITDRKMMEHELRRSEERFRSLIEQAPIAIGLTRNGRFIYANPRHLEMFGYDRIEELLGHPIFDLFAPQDRSRGMEGNRRLEIGLPEAVENEFMGLRKDGTQFPFHVAITKVDLEDGPAIVGFISDITQRAKDRNKIEELAARTESERQRLRTILDTMPIAVAVADAEGKLIEENAQASALWVNITPGPIDISGYGLTKGWSSDTGVPLFVDDWPVSKALSKGETTMGMAIDVQRLDGHIVTMLLSAAPLRDAQGKVLGVVSVAQDITHQRRLEEEAIEAKERAELYIDLLTHDINNMNTGIMGYLQLVRERGKLEEKDKGQIEKSLDILESSSHLIETVKKIQKLEMGGAGHGPVDLGWLLEDAVLEFKENPKERVTITYQTQHKRFVIASELLKDVFTNIIGNAIKHADGPVAIDVLLSKIYEDGRAYYRVSIEDNGPGIPDDMKEKIFSRLQRGKTRAGGAGLGLFLVKRFVEDFHGRAWVEDRIAGDFTQGSRLVVLLPAISRTPSDL